MSSVINSRLLANDIASQKNVINVLRVSTDMQDMQRQRVENERVVQSYGLNVVRTIEVEAVSGRSVRTDPRFAEVFRDLSKGGIDGVVINAIDRLVRPDYYEDFVVFDHFRRNNKRIWSAKEGMVDPGSDAGFIMSLFSGAQAGMEWRELRRRTSGAKMNLRAIGCQAEGGQRSRPTGIGYEAIRDPKTKRQIGGRWFHTEDIHKIRRMFDLLLAGYSERRIGAEVGIKGSGKIHRLLRNPIWIGIRRGKHGDVEVDIPHLLTRAEWDQAQEALSNRNKIYTHKQSKRKPRHLLSGLGVCRCGNLLQCRAGSPRKSGKLFDYYACRGHFPSSRHPLSKPPKKCSLPYINREAADSTVEMLIQRELLDKSILLPLIQAALKRFRKRDHNRDAGAQQQLQRLQDKKKRLQDDYYEGRLVKQDYTQRFEALDKEIREAQSRLPANGDVLDAKLLAQGLIDTFAQFSLLAFDEKRSFLRRAITSIDIDAEEISAITLHGGFLRTVVEVLTPSSRRQHSRQQDIPDIPLVFEPPIRLAA
jgi:DNA invertase Pin-like site-specific DNA recombinase